MNNTYKTIFFGSKTNTPLGTLWLAASEQGLWCLSFGINQQEFLTEIQRRGNVNLIQDTTPLATMFTQMHAYLNGEPVRLDFPIDWQGMTEFQILVCKAVMQIPAGSTASYGQVAARIGKPAASRAVGRVNATNPIPLVIPCHRVVGSDGSLTGYGGTGGLHTKEWLLELERQEQESIDID